MNSNSGIDLRISRDLVGPLTSALRHLSERATFKVAGSEQRFEDETTFIKVPLAEKPPVSRTLQDPTFTIGIKGEEFTKALYKLSQQRPATLPSDKASLSMVLSANGDELRMELPVYGGFAEVTCPCETSSKPANDVSFKSWLSYFEPLLKSPGPISFIDFEANYLRLRGESGSAAIVTEIGTARRTP